MSKRLLVILSIVVFVAGINKLAFGMMCGHNGQGHHQQTVMADNEYKHEAAAGIEQSKTEESVNVGNKICPVSGEKIDEKTKATCEYEGKIYNFCCSYCIEEFKKDPEKYIKKVEEELKTQPQGQTEEKVEPRPAT